MALHHTAAGARLTLGRTVLPPSSDPPPPFPLTHTHAQPGSRAACVVNPLGCPRLSSLGWQHAANPGSPLAAHTTQQHDPVPRLGTGVMVNPVLTAVLATKTGGGWDAGSQPPTPTYTRTHKGHTHSTKPAGHAGSPWHPMAPHPAEHTRTHTPVAQHPAWHHSSRT
jgi:hypothetical protein